MSEYTPSKDRPSWFSWLHVVGLFTIPALFALVAMLPKVLSYGNRTDAGPTLCRNTLKQIGIALQTYHDAHHCFPPAYFADEHGTPTHSWRAILLPYFESEEVDRLANQYRFDEPWNGPNNRKLLDKAPYPYRCMSDGGNESETSYLAIVGPDSMWRGTQPIAIPEMIDGTSKTMAIVECCDSGVNWLEPRDITFNDAIAGVNRVTGRPGIRSPHGRGANALFASGSVQMLEFLIDPSVIRAALTPAGGESVQFPY